MQHSFTPHDLAAPAILIFLMIGFALAPRNPSRACQDILCKVAETPAGRPPSTHPAKSRKQKGGQ